MNVSLWQRYIAPDMILPDLVEIQSRDRQGAGEKVELSN
jgi:hypothetical protein